MEGNCNVSNVIYEAEVLKEGDNRGSGHFYVGMASGKFKSNKKKKLMKLKCSKRVTIGALDIFMWGWPVANLTQVTINIKHTKSFRT